MLGLTIAAALSTAEPKPAQAPLSGCEARPGCRHVEQYKIRVGNGEEFTIVVGADIEFVHESVLRLLPGEMVVVALSPRGGNRPMVIEPREKWSADALPVFAIDEAFEEGKEDKVAAEAGQTLETRTKPSESVRLTFRQLPGKADSVLIVENGYGQALDYKATITMAGGKREATSVCEALAGVPSYEHWPYPIVLIELSEFHFFDPKKEGEAVSIACD